MVSPLPLFANAHLISLLIFHLSFLLSVLSVLIIVLIIFPFLLSLFCSSCRSYMIIVLYFLPAMSVIFFLLSHCSTTTYMILKILDIISQNDLSSNHESSLQFFSGICQHIFSERIFTQITIIDYLAYHIWCDT